MKKTGRKGESYIDICVFVLCAVLAGSILLEFVGGVIAHTRLMTKAEYLLDYATYYGRTGGYGVETLIAEFQREGIDVRVSSGSRDMYVQFGNQITVVLSQQMKLGFGNGAISVPLRYECRGLSKRYWKE